MRESKGSCQLGGLLKGGPATAVQTTLMVLTISLAFPSGRWRQARRQQTDDDSILLQITGTFSENSPNIARTHQLVWPGNGVLEVRLCVVDDGFIDTSL